MVITAQHLGHTMAEIIDGIAKEEAAVPSSRRMLKSPISLDEKSGVRARH